MQDAASSIWFNQHQENKLKYESWIDDIFTFLMTIVTLVTLHYCMKPPSHESAWRSTETSLALSQLFMLIIQACFKQYKRLRFVFIALIFHFFAIAGRFHLDPDWFFWIPLLTSLFAYYAFVCSFCRNHVPGSLR